MQDRAVNFRDGLLVRAVRGPPDMTNLASIAAALSERGKTAMPYFSEEWQAGPDLPDAALNGLAELRQDGLVDRGFGDAGPLTISYDADVLTTRMRACWYFRLSARGLALRDHLLKERG